MCRFYKKQKEGNLAEPTLRLVELPKLETFKIHCKFTSIIAAEFLKSCILGLGQPQYSFVAPCEWRFGLKGQFGTPVKWVITCKFWFGTRLEKKSLMNNCKTSDRILQHLQVDQGLPIKYNRKCNLRSKSLFQGGTGSPPQEFVYKKNWVEARCRLPGN